MTAPEQPSHVRYSVLVWPLAVLLTGYVPLLLFWRLGGQPAGMPGLFAYRSATWGDGLLLPLLALCLRVMTIRLRRQLDRRKVAVAAALGAAAGAALVLSWRADPHPTPNWTLPRPHEFTAAGIYHACFLGLACAFFAAIGTDFAVAVRRAEDRARQRALTCSWFCVALASAAGYGWLAVADAAHAGTTTSSAATLTELAIASAVLVVGVGLVAGRPRPVLLNTLVTSALLTCFTLVLVHDYPSMGALDFAALACAFGAGLGLAATVTSTTSVSAVEALAVCSVFGCVTLVVSTDRSAPTWLVLAAPVAAALGAVVLRWLRKNVTNIQAQAQVDSHYLVSAGISACVLSSAGFATWLGARTDTEYITGGFLLTIVGAVIGGVFFQYFKKDFTELEAIEGDPALRTPEGWPSERQQRAARRVWIRLSAYTVSAFAAILVLAITLGHPLGWQPGQVRIPWNPLFGGVAAGALLLLLPLASDGARRAFRPRPRPPLVPAPPPPPSTWPAWVCAVASVVVLSCLCAAVAEHGVFNPLAAVQAVLLMLFAFEGMAGNGAWLHLRRLDSAAARCAVTTGAGAVGLTVYWSLTGLVRPDGRTAAPSHSLLAWGFAAALVLALTVLTTAAVFATAGRQYETDYPPAPSASQDAFLLSLLWLALGWLPQTVIAHIPASAPERWAAIGTILASFMLAFGPPFLWVLENNDTHVNRQAGIRHFTGATTYGSAPGTSSAQRALALPSRVSRYPRALDPSTHPDRTEAFLARLDGHTAVQNTLALCLAVVSLVGLVGMTAGLTPDREL
ncbi:hypothetical protein ABT095_01560 [Kitasatospora sp. NPDC002227]|uniref:hypothetical protein n=1 Tax=Kitasatospora sp. NPDC002227 TaxID=3154773 RepID=UPI003329C18D